MKKTKVYPLSKRGRSLTTLKATNAIILLKNLQQRVPDNTEDLSTKCKLNVQGRKERAVYRQKSFWFDATQRDLKNSGSQTNIKEIDEIHYEAEQNKYETLKFGSMNARQDFIAEKQEPKFHILSYMTPTYMLKATLNRGLSAKAIAEPSQFDAVHKDESQAKPEDQRRYLIESCGQGKQGITKKNNLAKGLSNSQDNIRETGPSDILNSQ